MPKLPKPLPSHLTFTALLKALDRGQVDGLEHLLEKVAADKGCTRDDAWTAMSGLWRVIPADEERTLDEWVRAIRGRLRGVAARSLMLGAKGLRRADVKRARRDGVASQVARTARLAEAWDVWHARDDAGDGLPGLRADVSRLDHLLEVLLGGDQAVETRAFRMSVVGLAEEDVAARLEVPLADVRDLVARGRARVLASVDHPNVALALRRVTGEDTDEIRAATGKARGAVSMGVTRGCRALAAKIREDEA